MISCNISNINVSNSEHKNSSNTRNISWHIYLGIYDVLLSFSLFFATSASTSADGGVFLLYLCVDCLEQAKKTKAVFTYYKHTEIVSNLWSLVREAYALVFYHLSMLATLFEFSCFSGNTQECCIWSRTNFKVKSCCFCWAAALLVSMAINAAVGSLNFKFQSWINKAQAEWSFLYYWVKVTSAECQEWEQRENSRQWGEFKLFAISKFLRAEHSAVQRLIAFSFGRRWKIHFSTGKNTEAQSGAVCKCFAL